MSLALDNFGTGYSSLQQLQELPLDMLKIDRSFTGELRPNSESGFKARTLLKTITTLGHNLGLTVMAEGVETEQQLEYLKQIGCEEVQGYLFSHPLSSADFESYMNGPTILTTKANPKREPGQVA